MHLHRFAPFLLALAVLSLGACASGSALVTGNTRAPVALEQVKVYLEPPTAFEIIGLVSASSDAGWTEQGSVDYAIEELKKQAAKLGANGVLLISSGEKMTGYVYGVPCASPGLTTISVDVLICTRGGPTSSRLNDKPPESGGRPRLVSRRRRA